MNQAGQLGGWGEQAPSGVGKFLLFVKEIGLARGSMKRYMSRLWAGLGLQTPVDIRYAGLKFRVHPWDNVVENKMLFGSKPRDWPEIVQLRSFTRNGGVFLDIGANIGYYSLMAIQHGAARALAFEPNPRVYSRLQFNISANGLENQVSALQIALGDQVGTVTMIVSEGDLGGSHIGISDNVSDKAVDVQMKPLIDILLQEDINQVDALKIDVEGMEDSVLFPFFETSDRSLWPRLVIIEHTSQQAWKRDILSWMKDAGYHEIERNRSNAMLSLV